MITAEWNHAPLSEKELRTVVANVAEKDAKFAFTVGLGQFALALTILPISLNMNPREPIIPLLGTGVSSTLAYSGIRLFSESKKIEEVIRNCLFTHHEPNIEATISIAQAVTPPDGYELARRLLFVHNRQRLLLERSYEITKLSKTERIFGGWQKAFPLTEELHDELYFLPEDARYLKMEWNKRNSSSNLSNYVQQMADFHLSKTWNQDSLDRPELKDDVAYLRALAEKRVRTSEISFLRLRRAAEHLYQRSPDIHTYTLKYNE